MLSKDNKGIAAEVISDAIKLISNPKNWTKGTKARASSYTYADSVPSWLTIADKWSIDGAIERCSIDLECYNIYLQILFEIENECGMRATEFNDKASHQEVISLLNKVKNKISLL